MIVFKTLFNKALWLHKREIELRNIEDMTPLRKYIRKSFAVAGKRREIEEMEQT